jgi:hypothetical protein
MRGGIAFAILGLSTCALVEGRECASNAMMVFRPVIRFIEHAGPLACMQHKLNLLWSSAILWPGQLPGDARCCRSAHGI